MKNIISPGKYPENDKDFFSTEDQNEDDNNGILEDEDFENESLSEKID